MFWSDISGNKIVRTGLYGTNLNRTDSTELVTELCSPCKCIMYTAVLYCIYTHAYYITQGDQEDFRHVLLFMFPSKVCITFIPQDSNSYTFLRVTI